MIPLIGFFDFKENLRLNNTLFYQLAHWASCLQVQLTRPIVYLPRAIGQPKISTPDFRNVFGFREHMTLLPSIILFVGQKNTSILIAI